MITSTSNKQREVRESLLSIQDEAPVPASPASPLDWNSNSSSSLGPSSLPFGGSVGSGIQPWSALGEEAASEDDNEKMGIDKSATAVTATQEKTPPSSTAAAAAGLPTSFTFPVTFSAARSLHQELQNALVKTPGTGSWSPPVSIAGDEAWVIADEWGDEAGDADVQEVVTSYSPDVSMMKPVQKKAPQYFWQQKLFWAGFFFTGFILSTIIGTLSFGLTFVDVTIVATFFATQVALIQPACFPFLIALGRPWSMLAGAAFMILLADLESETAFEVIDMNTLALLFGASLLSANLEACQIQQALIDSLAKDSAPRMVVKLSLMAMAMSWIITNDGSALIISPVALRTLRRRPELPKLPIMLAVSSSANIGSALLLSGNPQNILVDEFSRESGLTFGGYMLWALVPTALCMVLNTMMLLFFLKKGYPMFCCCTRDKAAEDPEGHEALLQSGSTVSTGSSSRDSSFKASDDPVAMKNYRNLIGLAVISMIACFFIPGVAVEIGWVITAIAILVTCMYPLFTGKGAGDLLALVDYELLLLFTGLFVVTGGMTETGLMDKLWAAIQPHDPYDPSLLGDQGVFVGFVTALSNSVGNVPAVLLLENAMQQATDAMLAWKAVAWFSTIAGNLTLLGSAANVIVAAAAARAGVILTYGGYLKFGFFSTLLCMAVGMVWMNVMIAMSA